MRDGAHNAFLRSWAEKFESKVVFLAFNFYTQNFINPVAQRIWADFVQIANFVQKTNSQPFYSSKTIEDHSRTPKKVLHYLLP